MNYTQAIRNIDTINKLKAAIGEMLDKAAQSPEFSDLWISVKDFDGCKESIKEAIGEMCHEAKCDAEAVIYSTEACELREHQRQESTHYTPLEKAYA